MGSNKDVLSCESGAISLSLVTYGFIRGVVEGDLKERRRLGDEKEGDKYLVIKDEEESEEDECDGERGEEEAHFGIRT